MVENCSDRRLKIWQFCDGKAGHDSQSQGLCAALAKLLNVRVTTARVGGPWQAAWYLLTGRYPPIATAVQAPDLIVGAGHATHLPVLAARRAHGGRAVVLMRPSLPLRCFDLAIIPEHDAPPARSTVIATLGVLNTVKPSAERVTTQGLILIGGPSKHFAWSNSKVAAQVSRIVSSSPQLRWTVADSRRTPASFSTTLAAHSGAPVSVVHHANVAPEWLPQALSNAGQVWVTEDSVSMVYESLSAGAPTGLISIDRRLPNRVTRGIDALVGNGRVTRLTDWTPGQPPVGSSQALDESARCAALILERWPELTNAIPRDFVI